MHSAMPQTTFEIAPRKQKQQTLTQLDFARFEIESDTSENESNAGDDVDDAREQTASRKRRRLSLSKEMELKRQKTLTQIGFVSRSNEESDSEEGSSQPSASEHKQAPHIRAARSRKEREDVEAEREAKCEYNDENRPTTPKLTSSPLQKHHENASLLAIGEESSEVVRNSTFRTPAKPMRREIPSSQSPDDTPLSTRDGAVQPLRSPLGEIPFNVLAQRDASPTLKKSKGKGKHKGHHEDNIEEGYNQENMNPSWDSDENEETDIGGKADIGNELRLQSPTTSQQLRRPSNSCSLQDANLEPIRSYSHADEPPRPSQVSTIDDLENSPRESAPRSNVSNSTNAKRVLQRQHSPDNSRSSSPPPLLVHDDFFDSQLPDEHEGVDECSPLATIQETSDIVTVSQLLPDSLLYGNT